MKKILLTTFMAVCFSQTTIASTTLGGGENSQHESIKPDGGGENSQRDDIKLHGSAKDL